MPENSVKKLKIKPSNNKNSTKKSKHLSFIIIVRFSISSSSRRWRLECCIASRNTTPWTSWPTLPWLQLASVNTYLQIKGEYCIVEFVASQSPREKKNLLRGLKSSVQIGQKNYYKNPRERKQWVIRETGARV